MDDLTDRLNALTHVDKHLTNQITLAAEENIVNHEGRLDYQEDQSRRNNLHISGLPEEAEETWERCQVKLTEFFQHNLNLPPHFKRVHRVSKVTNNQ